MKIYADIEDLGKSYTKGEKYSEVLTASVLNGITYDFPKGVYDLAVNLNADAAVRLPLALDNLGRKIRIIALTAAGDNSVVPATGDLISGAPVMPINQFEAIEYLAVAEGMWVIINKS